MRKTYVKTLAEEALADDRIFGIVADIGTYTFDYFRQQCADRFINVGIAECNMIGMAAGLALEGKIPFVYTISPFLTGRAFEPIRVDICYQQLDVRLVGCGSGYAYSTLGATHHATDDIALMRLLPNMTVLSPADPRDVENAVRASVRHPGPVYIRIGRDGEPAINPDTYAFSIGEAVTVREGGDFTLIGTGPILAHALEAAENLSGAGVDVRVLNMHTVKPIDDAAVVRAVQETQGILTLEEHTIVGGLGSAVSEVLAENLPLAGKVRFARMGLNDCFCKEYGTPEDLDRWCGLTPTDIEMRIVQVLSGGMSTVAQLGVQGGATTGVQRNRDG